MNAEAEAKNQHLLEVSETVKLTTDEVIQATRQIHAKIVSKSAILKYEAKNPLTAAMDTLLEEVDSFRRAPMSSGRVGAEADLQKLKKLDLMLDNAITGIKM